MSAKVYYHIEADQLVLVWPVYQEVWKLKQPVCSEAPPYEAAAYIQCGFALEGPYGTLLASGDEIKKQCVEIGDFDEDQP